MRPFVLLAFTLVGALGGELLVACGGETPPAASPTSAAKAPEAPPAPAEAQPTEGVSRSAVDAAIKAGLGKFLAHGEVEASVASGKFVGWKVVKLHGAMWTGVDLHPDDIVTRVNGFPIERDHEADKAFKSLAVASEIRVSLLREGKPTELRFAIVDDK